MGFGHRVYRAEDPRARVLRRTARELGAPRYEVAEALEKAALAELRARRPDRVLATNVEFWSAVVLDFAEVPAHMFTSMFTCARTAGWSAHILEQKQHRPAGPAVGALRRPGPAQAATRWSRLGRAIPPGLSRRHAEDALGSWRCDRLRQLSMADRHPHPRRPQARRRPLRLPARRKVRPEALAALAATGATLPRHLAPAEHRSSDLVAPGARRARPSSSRCPTATRSSSATAAPPRSGTSPRSA